MAYSYENYTGNGSTKTFTIPFPYLNRDHVEVRVNDVLQTITTHYTFLSDSSISFVTAPASGAIVNVRRNTPKTARMVDFQDASVLTEASLDLDSNQLLYITQEGYDFNLNALGMNTGTLMFDALNKRITNVANPVNAQDVCTKNWAETGMTSQLALAAGHVATAQSAAASAFMDSMNAIDSAGAASVSAADALTYRNNALTYKTNAASSATAAANSATNAATSETNAAASAAAAAAAVIDAPAVAADRVAADASAAAAAASATAAAASELAASNYAVLAVGDVIGEFSYQAPSHSMLGTAAYQAAEQIFGRILPSLKSTAYQVLSSDNGKTLVVSGTTTITLPAASAVYNAADPFSITVKAVTGATVTVARSGTDTIETVAGNKSMTANTALTFFPTSTGAWETI